LEIYPQDVRPLVQKMLGCGWGNSFAPYEGDWEPCPEKADRIICLHQSGGPEHQEIRVCELHARIVEERTTPHAAEA
jgi:hypothetical protein